MLDTIAQDLELDFGMGLKFEGSNVQPLKVNKKARYCECGTKLSMYNLEDKCYRHLTGIAF